MNPADAPFTTPAMAAAFSAEAHIAQMLSFEAALARAEANIGVIPTSAAEAIAAVCRIELYDVPALYAATATAGTATIPLVQALTALVAAEARGYVHWGATSQDAIDTATMLQAREGLLLLRADALRLADGCARLAQRHRHTLMAGRTLLQQALPISFGLKAARWLAAVVRQIVALDALHERALAVQLGGAAGTLAALGADGPRVIQTLASELGLPAPELPWHAERDRVATLAAALIVLAGTVAKIASDIVLLAQTEVGEANEANAPGKGGSSTLPQKRNPVDATLALAAARLASGQAAILLAAMPQEHERAAGGWQAEWRALPDLFLYTAGAVAHAADAVAGLQIDKERMRANVELTRGLIMAESLTMALAPRLGRHEAQTLVQQLCQQTLDGGGTLRETAQANDRVSALLAPNAIERALDPLHYLGSSDTFIDRALALYPPAPS